MPSLVAICVNYYNEQQTIAFARRLVELHSPTQCQVIVASNNVTGDGNKTLTEAFSDTPQVQIVHWGENLGYFGAAARALREYLLSHELPDWVSVSNTDLLLEDGPFVQRLMEHSNTPGIGVVAPSVISTATGIEQNPFMMSRPPAFRMHLLKWVFKTRPTWLLWGQASRLKYVIRRCLEAVKAAGNNPTAQQACRPIYAAHGSFIVFRKEYFDGGGCLDHKPFLFGEEIMVAETARRLQLTTLYDPFIVLRHIEHSTVGESARVREYQAESARHCADQFFPFREKG